MSATPPPTSPVNADEIGPIADRIVEAILMVLETARGLKKPVSQFDIVSALFIADRRHVAECDRSITTDRYVAMPGGPVGSVAYDLLRHGRMPSGNEVPWRRFDQPGRRAVLFGEPTRLSSSEMFTRRESALLAEALRTVKALGYGDTVELTTKDPTYRSARARSAGNAAPIDLHGARADAASVTRDHQ